MVAGVVTVGKQQYAVGLYWENSPGGGRVAQIAKEAAKQPGQQADFYVVRPGNKDGRIPQFGLSSAEAGQKAGMPVLAGCLASQVPGSWAGAFRLQEGIAIVIVRDDLIVPDGDLFFLDETEARDRLIQEVGFGGLQSVYAPEAWSVPGADSIPLTLLLSDQKDIQLQRVALPKKAKLIAAGGFAAVALVIGVLWYQQDQAEKENLLRAQQQEALRRAQQAASLPSLLQQQQPPEPKYDRKWETAPLAMDVVKSCYEGLARVPAAVAGWKMTALKCTGGSINISWSRDRGHTAPPPGASVNDTASTATQTVLLAPTAPRGSESLADIDDITNRYLLQNWPGTITRASDDPLPSPPNGYTGPWNPPPPPWVKRSFTLNVPELPASLPVYFENLPGVIINSMSFSPGGSSAAWTIEGVIYENRK